VHLIICGRNEAAAKEMIASFPQTPDSTYEFLPCDATLMSNVTTACRALLSSSPFVTAAASEQVKTRTPLTKLNYLFLSPGYLSMRGRDETPEGLDKKFALHFYARFKSVTELMPLLKAATEEAGEDARVVTVLAPGKGGAVDLTDLGLKRTFSATRCGLQGPTYNSLMVEEFAARYPVIGFTHVYPGLVDTPLKTGHWALKAISPLFTLLMTSPQDCAEWMMRPLFDPSFSKGAFHLDSLAEPVPAKKLYMTEQAQKAVYEHLLESISPF